MQLIRNVQDQPEERSQETYKVNLKGTVKFKLVVQC